MIERQDVWGESAYRVWLPAKDAVVRARALDLAPLASIRPTVEQILHTTAAAKLLDALEDNLLLAPIQSSSLAAAVVCRICSTVGRMLANGARSCARVRTTASLAGSQTR